MKQLYIHILSISMVVLGFAFIAFLYWSEPRTLAEVTTKSQVAIGTYQVDKAAFERGIERFRNDDFEAARKQFEAADPEDRDAAVQFYIAYSYYRQGWGRLSNNDDLFTKGLAAVNHAIELDPNYRPSDDTLDLKTPDELRNELADGLRVTPSDFNPLKLTRERK